MKYLFTFLIIAVLDSCNQKEEKKKITETTKAKTEPLLEDYSIKIDTLKIILDEDSIQNDAVYIHFIEKIITKDSIEIYKFRLDFYRDNVLEKSFPIELNIPEEDSEWYFNYGLTQDEDEKNANSFFTLSNGYPACGYTQTHFLFFTKKNAFQIIDSYFSVGDSGWFSTKTFSEYKENSFSSRNESYWPEDTSDNEDIGILSFSDSTVYSLQNNSWQKQLITPKDTVYKSEKKAFNEF